MALLFTKMRLLGFKSKGALSHETVSFTRKMQDENRAGATFWPPCPKKNLSSMYYIILTCLTLVLKKKTVLRQNKILKL